MNSGRSWRVAGWEKKITPKINACHQTVVFGNDPSRRRLRMNEKIVLSWDSIFPE